MFHIDHDIIDQVKGSCFRMEICLSGDLTLCGKVKETSQNYLVVEPYSNHQCTECIYGFKLINKDTSEEVFVCSCPVRKAIHRKYRK